jgi:hypothetical protein
MLYEEKGKKEMKKRKETILFFLFCFPRASPFAPMSRYQLPSVKYVYAVDYKTEYDSFLFFEKELLRCRLASGRILPSSLHRT